MAELVVDTIIDASNPFDELDASVAQDIQSIYTHEQLGNVIGLLSALRDSVQRARSEKVDPNIIESRLQQLVLSFGHAVPAFMDLDDYDVSHVDEEWISHRLLVALGQEDRARDKTRMTRVVSEAVMNHEGDSRRVWITIFNSVARLQDPYLQLSDMSDLFPRTVVEGESTVKLWPRKIFDGTRPLAIGGYERTGVTALRRNIADMHEFRKKPWVGNLVLGSDEIVSCDSWMLTRPENVESLLGESMDVLQEKGLKWVGPTDILNPHDMDIERIESVTTLGRVVAPSVYALQLRDNSLSQFMLRGVYPTVGSFTMPRSTFHNFRPHSPALEIDSGE